MKLKRKHIVTGTVIILLIAAVVYFLEFTSIGYMATIQFRGFDEIQDNVYLDNDYQDDVSEILNVINEAETRLADFWGVAESRPTIIISDNENKCMRMGLNKSPALTSTFVLGGARNYILISSNGINVDVIAHELTHAEIYSRLYEGYLFPSALIPVWFDEGLATQNDYREKYSEDAWTKATDNGKNITNFDDLASAAQFFNPDDAVRNYNYIISKHEVNNWIEQHGIKGLIALINGVNTGKDFRALYYAK